MKERARQILENLFFEAMETPGSYISTTIDRGEHDEELLLIGDGGWDDFDAFFDWIFEIIEDRYYDIGMYHEYRGDFVTEEQVEDELIEELEDWRVAYIEEEEA